MRISNRTFSMLIVSAVALLSAKLEHNAGCEAYSTTTTTTTLFQTGRVSISKPTNGRIVPPPSFLHQSQRMMSSSAATQTHKTSSSALSAIYASGSPPDLVDAKVEKFRPGPEVSIGSLKLNWYGMLWGVIGVSLGFFWWLGLALCQGFQFITRQKFDQQRRLPVEISHLWGTIVLRLTNCYPVISGKRNLDSVYTRNKETKKRKPVMFVANHASWMDIYFVGVSVGWHNYKMVAKSELLKVPFLSKSLKVAKHILLDRTNLKSQLQTYKAGVKYLKDGVNLVTFAEGTRSPDGRLGPFKKGAFRMATATGAAIVPISIRYAHKVHPKEYVLPVRMGRRIPASIHIGEPIETEGKSEEELMEAVWYKIAEKLPESQKPLAGTPKTVN